MLEPGFSIVVPTYNNVAHLALTLTSIAQLDQPEGGLEVIVIDDGSSDETAAYCASGATPAPVRYFHQEDLGFRAAAARNQGVRAARFDTLAFCDTGVLLRRDALKRVEAEARAVAGGGPGQPRGFVALCYGVQEYTNENQGAISALFAAAAETGPFDPVFTALAAEPSLRDCRARFFENWPTPLRAAAAPWAAYWTCCAFCPTSAAQAIGGFDEAFTSWGGEDVEFAYRLTRYGVEIDLIADHLATHLPHPKNADARRASSTDNLRWMAQKHGDPVFRALELGGWRAVM